jgi:RNA polymerase primary sigma factor
MKRQQADDLSMSLDAARRRGWTTLQEILMLASSSPVDTQRAINIASESDIEVGGHADADAWATLAKLAEAGSSAFSAEREGPPPREELTPDSSDAIYIQDISRTPLLTANEEIRLAQGREVGAEAASRLAAGVDEPAERTRLEEAVRLGKAAERRLIEANLRLVVSVARKYLNRGVSFLDLVQEGNIGLQRGVEKYDWRRGFRFSTYAYWWIRQAVSRAVAEQGRTIRLPVHVFEQLTRLYNTARVLQVELGREPTAEEIGQRLGIDPERIREAFAAARTPISLDSPVGEDGDTTIATLIADASGPAPAEEVEEEIFADELLAALGKYLTPREIEVVRLRYGLGDGQPHTLTEIGEQLGISRERARQIEAAAMRKLKAAAPRLRQFRESAL